MRKIDFIVIHCTAGPQNQSVAEIRRFWQRQGWTRPGYHRLIAADGTVHHLADYSQITNGVAGHNSRSIHISYMGGVGPDGRPLDNRTPQQREAMERLVREAAVLFPAAKIQGHRDFSPDKNRNGVIEANEWMKACPSFSVSAWLHEIGLSQARPIGRATTAARVNMREGPSILDMVIMTVSEGTTVEVLHIAGAWSFVQVVGHTQKGWIRSDLLRVLP